VLVSVYVPVKSIALLSQFNVFGLPAEAGAGRLELILIREKSFTAPRSGTDITTFGEEEEFRIASKSSSELRIRGGPWLKPWPRITQLNY
jgi:hypothetical protein